MIIKFTHYKIYHSREIHIIHPHIYRKGVHKIYGCQKCESMRNTMSNILLVFRSATCAPNIPDPVRPLAHHIGFGDCSQSQHIDAIPHPNCLSIIFLRTPWPTLLNSYLEITERNIFDIGKKIVSIPPCPPQRCRNTLVFYCLIFFVGHEYVSCLRPACRWSSGTTTRRRPSYLTPFCSSRSPGGHSMHDIGLIAIHLTVSPSISRRLWTPRKLCASLFVIFLVAVRNRLKSCQTNQTKHGLAHLITSVVLKVKIFRTFQLMTSNLGFFQLMIFLLSIFTNFFSNKFFCFEFFSGLILCAAFLSQFYSFYYPQNFIIYHLFFSLQIESMRIKRGNYFVQLSKHAPK